jgi:hypothetical protein
MALAKSFYRILLMLSFIVVLSSISTLDKEHLKLGGDACGSVGASSLVLETSVNHFCAMT